MGKSKEVKAEEDRSALPESSMKKHYGRGGAGNVIPSTNLDPAETMANLEDEGNQPLRTPYFGFGRNGAGNMVKFTSRQEAEAFLKEAEKQKGSDEAPNTCDGGESKVNEDALLWIWSQRCWKYGQVLICGRCDAKIVGPCELMDPKAGKSYR